MERGPHERDKTMERGPHERDLGIDLKKGNGLINVLLFITKCDIVGVQNELI